MITVLCKPSEEVDDEMSEHVREGIKVRVKAACEMNLGLNSPGRKEWRQGV